MATIPAKVASRIEAGIKRFQPILSSARTRDVGESDTVTIVVDMLAEVFGYDKYTEITSEHAIKSTFCDIAIKIDGDLKLLAEVKAIGLELKDVHVKQAVDYAANQGVDWVVLTNGICWRIYKVSFGKPINQEMVMEVEFCLLNGKSAKDVESLFLLCKEGWSKSVLGEYHAQKQALSRFFIGAMVLSEPVLDIVRRERKKMSPDVRITVEEIRKVMVDEVLKRDVLEGDKADEARKKVTKSTSKPAKPKPTAKTQQASAGHADEPSSSGDTPISEALAE